MKPSKRAFVKRAKPLLGTLVSISAKGEDIPCVHRAVNSAFEAVEKVHRLMSAHHPSSDLGRLSRQGPYEPIAVDPWTHEVLALSRRVSLVSDGLFDVTVGGLMEKAGFLPASGLRSNAPSNYMDIDLLPNSQVLLRRSCRIDLGGVAKGYAVDKALEAAQPFEKVWNVVVNAGGDLGFRARRPQEVWVRDPFEPSKFLPWGRMKEGAIASSGGVGALRDSHGGPRVPLFKPGGFKARRFTPGVVVTAPTCALADALTKVVALAPEKTAAEILRHFQARAWVARKSSPFREVGADAEKPLSKTPRKNKT